MGGQDDIVDLALASGEFQIDRNRARQVAAVVLAGFRSGVQEELSPLFRRLP
jgi:hypothetical protein